MQRRPPPPHRSSTSTPACSRRPTCSPPAPPSGSWSRSASTSATAPTFTPSRTRHTNDEKERPYDTELTTFGARVAHATPPGRYVVGRLCAGDDAERFLGDGRPMARPRHPSTVRRDRVAAGNTIPYSPIPGRTHGLRNPTRRPPAARRRRQDLGPGGRF